MIATEDAEVTVVTTADDGNGTDPIPALRPQRTASVRTRAGQIASLEQELRTALAPKSKSANSHAAAARS